MCGGARRAGWHFSLDLPISRRRKKNMWEKKKEEREQNRKEGSRAHTLRDHQLANQTCMCCTKVAFSQNLCCEISLLNCIFHSEQCVSHISFFFFFNKGCHKVLRSTRNNVISHIINAKKSNRRTEGSPEKVETAKCAAATFSSCRYVLQYPRWTFKYSVEMAVTIPLLLLLSTFPAALTLFSFFPLLMWATQWCSCQHCHLPASRVLGFGPGSRGLHVVAVPSVHWCGWDYEWLFFSMCQDGDGLMACPWCTHPPPATPWG